MSSLFIIGEMITVIGLEGGGRCGEETPLLPELGELVFQEGAVEERDDRLGTRARQRPEASALAAGQDHGLGVHGSASSMSMMGMSSRMG